MHVITRSCVLLLWMYTLALVKSQDCTLETFLNGPLFDTNFDTTDLEASYPAGKQVRVSCNVGYSGFFKLICVEGKWLSRGDKCQPRSCGHPGDAQFADFHLEKGDDFVFGSQVVYTCHKGYQMVSRTNYRRCMAQGWDGVVPVCEAQQCPVIHVDSNVQVNGDPEEATFGNVVRFSCKSSTEILSGPSEIYCDENGDWSGRPPKCEAIRCTVPVIENGYVPGAIEEYKEHEVLHFECNPQYRRTEGRPSKCIKLGSGAEWSPTPVCEPIRCKVSLPPLEGTSYDPAFRNVFSPGDTLRVICGEKYWISKPQDASAETTCKEDGEWTVRPICQEVTCSNRRDRHVTWWDVYWGQRITLGETARYRCRSDYKSTDGTNLAICTRDGWRPDPLCKEITCDRQAIENADIVNYNKQTYKYNEQANYVCKDGYEGSPTRTCGESGWIGRSRCTEKTCNKPDINDAYIMGTEKRSYQHNEQVEYACTNDGERRFTVTCTKGVWTGIQDCTACLKAYVPHGFVVSFGDKLYYTCDEGYKLFTKGWWGEAKCIDRLWSGLGRCIENRECGEIPVIPNREVTPQQPNVYGNGRSIWINCKEGYRAQVDRLTCHEGTWRSSGGLSLKTICTPIAKHCNPPPKVENAVVVTSYQKKYSSDSEVTYQCRKKYQMEGEASIRCKDGEWEKNNINCTQYCDKLKEEMQTVTFTPDKERYMNGEEIQYQCITTDANGTTTCVNGEWNKTVECEADKCKVTGVSGSVHIITHVPDNLLRKGQNLTFHCRRTEHFLHGNAEVECLANGQWSHPFPTCGPPLGCRRPPPLLEDGDTKESGRIPYRHNERVEYTCLHFYTMEGEPYQTCINGEWTGQMRCIKKCKVTGVSDSVHIITHVPDNLLRKGQNLTFRCRRTEHFLHGNAEVECLANGQWSHPFPTCGPPLGCRRPPPLLEDGDTKQSGRIPYRHNERVEYICQSFYTMEGEPYQTCINGEWTGQMRCIKPCTVDKEAMSRHNIAFKYSSDDKLYSAHNDEIEFKCTRGSRVGTVKLRQRCVEGVMHLPTCQSRFSS